MPIRASDIIRRGASMDGRQLLDAIEAAGVPPRAGPGMRVLTSGQQSTVRRSGHQIIPKGQATLPVLLQVATSFAVNRWDYAWKTAKVDPATLNYIAMIPADSGYLTSTFASERKARNLFEQTNTAEVVLGGTPVTIGNSTITIGPVPSGQPALLSVAGTVSNQTLRVFSLANPTTGVSCLP